MKKTNNLWDVLGLIVVVGGAFVLTRPGSQGPALFSAATNGFMGSLATAEGTGIPKGFSPVSYNKAA